MLVLSYSCQKYAVLKKSSTLFSSRKLSIMSSNWDRVTPHATGLDEQSNFAHFQKLMLLIMLLFFAVRKGSPGVDN